MGLVFSSGDVELATYLEIAQSEGEASSVPILPAVKERVVVLDFGSQYNQLIVRRVRESGVYSQLLPLDTPPEKIIALDPIGFILSGGPGSVYEQGVPPILEYVLKMGRPILGICYGMQVLAYALGGKVIAGKKREYGSTQLYLDKPSPLFEGLSSPLKVWMSHGDVVTELPPNFQVLAYTENCPIAAMGDGERKIYGVLFHPEVVHTPQGKEIIGNFLYRICGCSGGWKAGDFIPQAIEEIRRTVGDGRVICALSGGIDSAVTATLVHKTIGDRLICLFINNGLLRLGEAERILNIFRNLKLNLVYIDAQDRFLARLKGITDPEEKRKAIGEEFIRVFEEEAVKIGKVDFLAQGTLYPDVIESAAPKGAARIKSHHNVGGLPAKMKLKLLEPLRFLFKDEVREIALKLGLPEEIVWRQPFPGPGLAIRIIGEVTKEKLEILRAADWILMNEIKKAGLYRQLWQCFAVLTDAKSVGVMGDRRSYGYVVAIRAVVSEDGMTADWAHLPYELLGRISNRIVNEVSGISRVVYDITSKPPATIEWE